MLDGVGFLSGAGINFGGAGDLSSFVGAGEGPLSSCIGFGLKNGGGDNFSFSSTIGGGKNLGGLRSSSLGGLGGINAGGGRYFMAAGLTAGVVVFFNTG